MNDLIKQFLKEHLTINIKKQWSGLDEVYITVELLIDGEMISSDSISIE